VPALARGDVERLLRFVAEAESLGGEHAFTEELLSEVGRLVDADWIGYNELDCVRRQVLFLVERPGDPADAGLDEDEWTILEQHPICQAHARGDFRTLKLSDFFTSRELRRTGLYHDWFAPFDVEHEVELALPAPQWHTRTFVLDRAKGRRDFSERDRLVLDLLKPHLTRLLEKAAARRRAPEENEATQLTAREREVLAWVARGKTNPQIAEALWVSPATVRKHLENVYGKLGVNTRTAAVAQFLGLSDAGDDAAAAGV
jgi:DNA-binding CsgD family transcriptional regulator